MKAVGLVFFLLAVAPPALGEATATFQTIHPGKTAIAAGTYHLDLGDADDPANPRSWQGPIRITRANHPACTVSDDVSIIEPPIRLTRHHLLYVSTYSGSENRLYVVDARDCAIRWTSPFFNGASTIVGHTLELPGAGAFSIDANGIPER